MRRFRYEVLPCRVEFGAGSLAGIGEFVTAGGWRRGLVLSTPEQRADAERIAGLLGNLAVGIYAGARMHVPMEIAREARELAGRLGADLVVAVGGGSTTGLAKAIALEMDIAIAAIPTTYAGSEMTPIWGITEDGVKTTGRSSRVLPRLVVYDPELTLSLPPGISGTSGMNSIAHAVEALYAENANPITSLMSEEAIRALARALPEVVRDPVNLAARSDALYGAWLSGTALGTVGMALHHKLCHVLGGSFGLPHAETHTIVLPHAAAYNREAAPDSMRRVAGALGGTDAPHALFDLAGRLGAPRALRALGLAEVALEHVAELATQNPYYNPAPVTRDGIRVLLDRAWCGLPPL